eukprot:COSAG02_NODE_35019_length_475_cov_0.712766_1_plen_48_part_10
MSSEIPDPDPSPSIDPVPSDLSALSASGFKERAAAAWDKQIHPTRMTI